MTGVFLPRTARLRVAVGTGIAAAALAMLALLLTAGGARAAGGTPGTPEAPTTVYSEGFDNTDATTAPVPLTSYTSAGGETYTADPPWLTSCNGEIVNFNTPYTDLGNCANTTDTGHTRQLAYALGLQNGTTDPTTNQAVTAYTDGNPGANLVEFETGNPIPLPENGRFLDFSVNTAAVNCTVSAPLYQFELTNGGTSTPVGGQINACSSGKTVNAPASGPVAAEPISVGSYASSGSVLFTGSSLGIQLINANGSGDGNDAAFDDIKVLDVTPQLDKSFTPATITAGGASTLTFTITNTSELAAKDGWSFTDHLPSGLTVASPSGASTTCSSGVVTAPAGGTAVAVSGNLDAGQASCTVSVNVTAGAIGSYTNGPGNVTTTGLNTPPPTTLTAQGADLQVTKSASPATGVPGQNETYTLVAKNNGPATATAATVTDPLPSNLTFVSASSGCSDASGTVTCAAGDMASGATKTFTVVAKIASSDTARIINTATVHSSTPDPVPSNNTSTFTTPVGPKADLAITKTPSTTSLVAGGQVTYTLVVTDNGPSDATGVTVSDALPAGETLVSTLPSQGSCSGTTCNLGTIADGGTAQILVTATVATSASGRIPNTATVTGNGPDPKTGNNTGTSTINVTPPPVPAQPVSDLQITKHVNHAKATVGQTLTYTLKVTNHGPDTATNAKITDTPSMAMKVLSAKPARGSCKVAKAIRCSLGTIANGKTVTIKVTARITKIGTERNAGSTTSASRDPKIHNNLAKATTRLVKKPKPKAKARAILHLRKLASRRTVTAGQTLSYRIKVSASRATAHNVKVCDALPLGLSFQGARPKAKLSHGKECWTIKTLAAGRSRTLTVHAKALKGTNGRKVNHATATGKGLKTARAKATVRIKPAPKPPATPVTG